MSRINILDKATAEKIAAGEVIENPLSVVKELFENSVDAGADNITVEIKNGGKSYIRVSDNGCGIDKSDIRKAFVRHATSKIVNEDDLERIKTLGFRGEALTSIAAVSNLELVTKTEIDKTGIKLTLNAGEEDSFSDIACETGTTIIVNNLFYNMPARLKFLKADNQEATLITDFISKASLAYPHIKIRLINNGIILFSTPGKGDVYKTILTVYSPQNAKQLLPVDYSGKDIVIKGYTSSPLVSKTNRKMQVFFVNGRYISSKLLTNAVSDAYHDKLFDGRFPIVYLFLEINPAKIDVNIHPRKAEIKFFDEESVKNCVVFALRNALLNKNALDCVSEDNEAAVKPVTLTIPEVKAEYKEQEPTKEPVSFNYRDSIFSELRVKEEEAIVPETKIIEKQEEFFVNEDNKRLTFSSLSPISQIFTTYILAKDKDNFYIIDQHAAHERVMFEKLLYNFNKDSKDSQLLLTPFLTELNAAEAVNAPESIKMLENLGFNAEIFGDTTYRFTEIPSYMSLTEAEDFVQCFFETADEYKANIQIRKDEIISRSCKSAIKGHDKLSFEEINALFEALDKCENPYSCPHGRPTFIKFSEYELERMFKRK